MIKLPFEIIPPEYHLLIVLILALSYYVFPRWLEWREGRRYYLARLRVLEYRKLLYEIEAIRSQKGIGFVSDEGLDDLIAYADGLRPKMRGSLLLTKGAQLFWVATGGFALILPLLLLGIFTQEINNVEDDLIAPIVGNLMIVILWAVMSLVVNCKTRARAFWGGGGLFFTIYVPLCYYWA